MLSQFVTVVFVLCCGVLWFWSVGCCVCCVVCCFFFLFYLVVWCVGVGPLFCGGVLLWVFCFWCSSGWLWWLCCSVRFFAPGSCVALLVVLGGSWSSSAVLLLVVFLLLLVVDLGCVAPPLFIEKTTLSGGCVVLLRVLCVWVVVRHPVGSSASCVVD